MTHDPMSQYPLREPTQHGERVSRPEMLRGWPAENGGPPPRDVWRGLVRRNVGLIIGCSVLSVAAAALTTRHLAPTYEAWASVRIDDKPSGLPALDVLRGLASGSEINTEQEILASRGVAEDIVDSLALQLVIVRPAVARDSLVTDIAVARAATPGRYRLVSESASQFVVQDTTGAIVARLSTTEPARFGGVEFRLTPAAGALGSFDFEVLPFDDAVDALRSELHVDRPSRDVDIVEVRYRGTDRGLVQTVPNVAVARFIARRQDGLHAATRTTASFLRTQAAKLAAQLQTSENALRQFREREHVVSLPDQARSQISRVADLQAQRSALETERSALARLVAQARASAARQKPGEPSPYRDMLAFPTLLRNQAASQLLASLTAIEDRKVDLLTRRSVEDPDVKLLASRTAELEDQLRRIAETYLQGLADQITSIDSTLGESEEQLEAVPYREVRLARLQRDAKGLEDIYSLVQSRLKEAEIAVGVQDGSVRVVDWAVMPRRPVSPRPLRTLALALGVGLLFGVAAAFSREQLDKSVHSRRDVQSLTGLPVLGLVPAIRPVGKLAAIAGRAGLQFRWKNPHRASRAVVAQAQAVATREGFEWGIAREAFNGLHAGLSFATEPAPGRTLIITSPLPSDGKTTVAVNLAATVARQGHKVLLVDGDMRRGIVYRALRIPRAPGLAEVLSGATDIGGALRTIGIAPARNLYVLANGTPMDDPADSLAPDRVRQFIDRIAAEFDWVFIDTPPLNVVADAAVLSGTGAGVVLVVRAGVTPADALAYAVERLRSARASIVGIALNGIDKREASYDSVYSYQEYSVEYGADRESSVGATLASGTRA